MSQSNSNLDDLMKSPQAAGLLKNKDAVMGLMKSPDAQKLMQMLNQSGGDGLKSAANSAIKGDASQLMGMLQKLMSSKEGADIVNRINNAMPKE